ncbi:MAG: PmeII family type II restriction endonuclease [Chloroflexi bacterium]|nr:PmeII family type II restriction endonuclease [Chloroflexota bacterium]
MSGITDEQITLYVRANIGSFHEKRLEALNELKLSNLLRRKNPYLFRSKNLVVAADLIKSLLDAHLSSQEETLFGDFLEGLAIYVAETVHGGLKSSATGIDLEFLKDNARYIVSIKSGPNWGNSSQVAKMKADFRTAARVIRQGNAGTNVIAVNGCCYGRDTKPDKGDYFKYCGQEFWELISNDAEFYTRIVEPLGHNAKIRNDAFNENYGAVINRLSSEFAHNFCDKSGAIDWSKFVAFSSAKGRSPRLKSLAI